METSYVPIKKAYKVLTSELYKRGLKDVTISIHGDYLGINLLNEERTLWLGYEDGHGYFISGEKNQEAKNGQYFQVDDDAIIEILDFIAHKPFLLKNAFERTLATITNFFSPFAVLFLFKNLYESVAFVRENLLVASIFLALCLILLCWNVWVQIRSNRGNVFESFTARLLRVVLTPQKYFWNIWIQIRSSGGNVFEPFTTRLLRVVLTPREYFRKLFPVMGFIASLVSILLLSSVIIIISTTNAYYVRLSSEPNQKAAVRKIAYINSILEKKGITDLRARAYASDGGNPWYMITINRSHFNRKAAVETLERAKEVLGGFIPSDAYIYSTSELSMFGRIKSLFPE